MASTRLQREPGHWDARVQPDYTVEVGIDRRYMAVSDSFCKLLGYEREELIGKRIEDLTAPGTNDVNIVFDLFGRLSYMHGVWILLNRAHNTKIIVRYEAWLRGDSCIECKMELIGAGA
jgi:PAS domain-containing protein